MIFENFVVPLVATIVIECLAAFLLGYREKLLFGAIVIINFVTNPFLNFIILLLDYFQWMEIYLHTVLFMEVIIVFIEWIMLCYIFPYPKKQLFVLSFVMNLASYLAVFLG